MNKGISILIRALAIVLIAAAGGASATEVSGSPDDLREFLNSDVRTVQLSNQATETAYTDIAKINLIVLTENRQLSPAIEENTRVREELSRSLVSAGIDAEDIKSSKYSASPQYGWFGKTPSSYEVVNTVVVSVDSESEFLAVSALADSLETVTFGDVAFELSDEAPFEDSVRDKALKAVLADAAYFEQELGLKLSPVAFRYSSVDRFEREVDYIEEIIVTASRNRASFSDSAPVQAPTTFDEVDFSVTVQVTFEVGPGD